MEPHDKDQLDKLLDGALRRYADVEPRAGLEGRVLSNLAANNGRTSARSTWAWTLAGAAAMVVVVGLWIGTGHRRPAAPVAVVQPNVAEAPAQNTTEVIPPLELKKPAARRIRSRQTAAAGRKATEPRLAQFPSRRPIADEDLVVAEYVQRFPEEAKLLLQEQQKFDEEVQQAQQEVENNRNSDNLER